MGIVTRRGGGTIRALTVVILLGALQAALSGQAAAQEPAAALHGRVTDSTGRGLADVTITVQSPDLIRPSTSRSSVSGGFAFPSLPAGPYVVAFAREGLVPVKHTMTLSAAEHVTLHVVLRPNGGFSGAMTVMTERTMFPPSWMTVLDAYESLQQFPVTGAVRSAVALTTELPGIQPEASLFLLDGLPLRHGWQLRSPLSFAGPGPEALRETAVSPGALPAGYGRLEAGTIAAVTGSGRQRLHGSFRADFGSTLNADLVDAGQSSDELARTLEYTGGGPIGNRTWFFTTGRHLTQSVSEDLAFTDRLFTTAVRDRFGLVKVTHAADDGHRLTAEWVGTHLGLSDAKPIGFARVADTSALESRTDADRAFSGAYVGQLRGRAVVTARYTRETGAIGRQPVGVSNVVDDRTPVIDQETGAAFWASGSCEPCDPQRSAHDTFRLTADMLASSRFGSHQLGIGYDVARDTLTASHPVGGNFELRATRASLMDGEARPVFAPGGATWIVWRPDADANVTFRSHAFFVTDRWLPAPAVAIDLGLRVDAQRGTAGTDARPVLFERTISPRLGATWRPNSQWPWTFNAGFGRYASGVVGRRLDASGATRPSERVFVYEGPAINAAGAPVPTADAVTGVLDWFFANGGTSRPTRFATEPGISALAQSRVRSPHVDEWSFGVSRFLGGEGNARADVTWRTYANLPGRLIDPSRPSALDPFGRPIDAGVVAPDDRLERRYASLSLTANYRFGHWADVGMRYTLSRLTGNADEATLAGTSLASAALAYPEYTNPSWHLPTGALPDDAPQRFRGWINSELLADETRGVLVLSLLYSHESGRPYGAAGWVGVEPFVTNPGYQQPPVAVRYYFTARDLFRTESIARTDLALAYSRRMPGTVHSELFAELDFLNLFDRERPVNPARLTITRTAFTDPSLQAFDPLTETPVEGVHWTFDDTAVRDETSPPNVPKTLGRSMRVTLGVRF